MRKDRIAVERRAEQYADRIVTKLWCERPGASNPYVAEQVLCHGYDMQELLAHCSYWEFIYLLFTGERADAARLQLLEKLAIILANPGPRHPATRAVMTAAVSKTDPSHLLPIGLSVLGGSHLGAAEVSASMRFLRRQRRKDPLQTVRELLQDLPEASAGDAHVAPGFGTRFAGIDTHMQQCAQTLLALPACGETLAWGEAFAAGLREAQAGGWLLTGLAAAAFLDLGLHPKWGAGLLQMLSVPGLLAHAMEMTGKPLTAMPFITDDRYFIDDPAES